MDEFQNRPDDDRNEPWNSPGGRTLANVVAIAVVVLALLVWADSLTFGNRGEVRLGRWFLLIALAFGGAFWFRRWLRRRGD